MHSSVLGLKLRRAHELQPTARGGGHISFLSQAYLVSPTSLCTVLIANENRQTIFSAMMSREDSVESLEDVFEVEKIVDAKLMVCCFTFNTILV